MKILHFFLHQLYNSIALRFIFLLCGVFFSFSSSAYAYEVKVFDSIAGYGTEIAIQNGEANQEVKILLLLPDNTTKMITYGDVLDYKGSLSFIVPPEDTTKAGKYRFTIVEPDQFYADGKEYSFEIFADDADFSTSQFFLTTNSVNTGAKAKGSVFLYDKYYNPIEGHRIKIFSSRDSDRITFSNAEKTDENGEVSFFIFSNTAGKSLISATDDTFGASLPNTLSIEFNKSHSSNGFFADATFGDTDNVFANVSRFEITFPDTVTADSDSEYLTLRVVDSTGNTVNDFLGSVKIIVPSDKNAIVPGQDGVYTFLEKDQGEILFSRSVVLPEKGKHSLEVYAYDIASDTINYNIFGKKIITVEEKKTNVTVDTSDIEVLSPSNNTTFSVSNISVKGNALANSDLKIVLDENPLLNVSVDKNGQFTGILKNVSEGEHVLYVYQKENDAIVSQEISFIVDTKVSGIVSMSLDSYSASPKDELEVTVEVEDEKDIDSLKFSWDGKVKDLDSIGRNIYQLRFNAPQKEGVYPLKITAVDVLNNSISLDFDTDLLVKKGSVLNSTISNLKAEYDSTSKKLSLSWDPLEEKPLLYVVESGIAKNSLNKIKSVSGKKNTVSLDDLAPGKYFFSITAVNLDGSNGAVSKTVEYSVSAPTPIPTPTSTPTPTFTPTPTSTPTPIVTVVPTPTEPPKPQLFIVSANGGLDASFEKGLPLFWDSYPKVEKYRISYGLASKSYGAELEIPKYITSKRINDLIPGVRYFVLLEALDSNGNVIFTYDEASAVPIDGLYHPAPTKPQPYPQWVSQTGPQMFVFLGGLFLFVSLWYLRKNDEIFE